MGSLKYREVQGFFTARVPDSGDADLNPDTIPLTGTVTFHPEYRKPLIFPGEHIVVEPISGIISDGHLMHEVVQGEDVVLQPLHLAVTMDERANQTWAWRLRFSGVQLGEYGETVDLPDVRFVIEEGTGPLGLSTVPQTTSRNSNAFITRGAPGPGLTDITAADGEITFSWNNGRTTSIDVPEAVPGPRGDDGEQGPRGIQGIQGPAGGGTGFPMVLSGWTDVHADSLTESGFYRMGASYPKAANGWPDAIEGMNATVRIIQVWSGLISQEVRGWSNTGGTPSYSRWLRIGSSGTTPWMTESDRGTYSSGTRNLSGSVHTDQGWNPEYGPTVTVDRYGPIVELTVESLQREGGSATGNYTVVDIPYGFRPSSNKYAQTWRDAMVYVRSSTGNVRITNPTGSLDYFSITYMTKDAPPTTLPGTPA